jgi:hypothetical protein
MSAEKDFVMVEQIFIALNDEGIDVWRPAPAYRVDTDTYIVLRTPDYDPQDESWQFPPGSIVVCETRQSADGVIRAAVRRKEPDKLTA